MTATRIDFADRADWLEKRRQGIGASDISAIMGLSPWSTALQVWVSKVMDEAPEPDESEDMRWGSRMETAIINEALERLTASLVLAGPLMRNNDHEWMLATPDALIELREESRVTLIEAKKVDDWSWDEIPTHYNLQIQWQLAVMGYEQGFLAVLHRGRRLEIYPVEADEDLQQAMILAAEGFWEMVQNEIPPPATGDDNAFMASLYPTAEERPVEVAPEIVQEVRAAKRSMAKAEKRLNAAQAALKEIMQDADTAIVGQSICATWKEQTRRTLDTKRLRLEDPVTADKYTAERTSRVLRVRNNEES